MLCVSVGALFKTHWGQNDTGNNIRGVFAHPMRVVQEMQATPRSWVQRSVLLGKFR